MRLSEVLATQAPEREQARGGSGMRLSAALQPSNTPRAASSPMRLGAALKVRSPTDFQDVPLSVPPESPARLTATQAFDSMPDGERPELHIRPPVMIPPGPLSPPADVGQAVSRETAADQLSRAAFGYNPFDRSLPAEHRTPSKVLADLRAGRRGPLTPDEFGSVLRWLEGGAFEDPQQVRNLLSLSLTREGLEAVDEAILVRRLLDEANSTQEKKGAGAALMEGLVRGFTLNAERPHWDPVTTDPDTLRLSAAMKRVGDIQREKLAREHPVATFGGEALSTVLPYSVGTKLLRGVRAARGLTPVVETPSGFVAEGAKVGGALEFLRRPEGAEQMGAGDELKARLTQSGIGIAAGAILDFGAAKLGQFVGRYTQTLRDKRLARALNEEAKARGFGSADEYVASLVDFVQTPDGVIVRPKVEVNESLPGEAAPFPAEHELRLQEHKKKATEHGLTEEQAAAFAPEPVTDPLTGFQGRRDREATVDRAVEYANKYRRPGHYVAFDLVNLNGLNAKLGEPGADRVYQAFARTIEDEFSDLPGQVQLFRHGGDEMSAVVLDIEKDVLDQAVARVQSRVSDFVAENDLGAIPHTKEGKGAGAGLTVTSSQIRTNDTGSSLLDRVNRALEKAKGEPTRDVGGTVAVEPFVPKAEAERLNRAPTRNGDFPAEHELRVQEHNKKAGKHGLTEEQAAAFAPEPMKDHLTGFQGRRDRDATLKRAIRYAADQGTDGHYVAFDLVNLGGLNAKFGESGADVIFRNLATIIDDELGALPGHVQLFRHGGDEMSAVVLGVDNAGLERALQRIEQRADEYVRDNGLESIPHTKQGKAPGTGINYGVSRFHRKTFDDILTDAHNRLELAKVAKSEASKNVDLSVSETTRAAGPDGQAGGVSPLAGGSHPGDGGEIRGADGKGRTDHETPTGKVDAGFKIRSPKGDYSSWRPERESTSQLFLPPAADEAAHQAALATFGRRVKHVETGTFPTGLSRIKNAADVAHVVAPLRKDAQESFVAVATDDGGNILRIARLHRGAQGEASVDPALVAGAVTNTPGATRAWIAHNHPSGNSAQSEADRVLTEKISDLLRGSGVELQGSVVVAPGGRVHSSVNNNGAGGFVSTPAKPRKKKIPVSERRLVGRESELPAIADPKDAHAAIKKLGGGRDGVLFLNDDNRPVGFLAMSAEEMRELRTGRGGGADRLLSALDETNASGFIIRTDSTPAVGNMNAFAEQSGRALVDALDSNGDSFTLRGDLPTQSTVYANPFPIALAHFARDIGLHPSRNVAAGAAGAVYGATNSEADPGSAKWWLDLAAGATGGMILSQVAHGTRLLGKGSIVDNARLRLGRYIESLPLIGRGPAEVRDLKRKQRLMRQMLDRQTEKVGEYLAKHFSPAERAMMADLIETRGIVKDLNLIHSQAQALDDYLTQVAERMKGLGMLPEELETGGYLHRYYAKHLGLDKLFREAKRQTLSGSYTIARGTEDVFGREYLSPGARTVLDEFDQLRRELAKLEKKSGDLLRDDTLKRIAELKARLRQLGKVELTEYVGEQNGKLRSFLFAADEVGRVSDRLVHKDKSGPALALLEIPGVKDLSPTARRWTVRGTKRDGQVLLRRDWTKAERDSWGEIQDAGYRYVRGMAEASHDMSLAVLFDTVAKRKDWVSAEPKFTKKGKPWVFVPETKVHKNSPLRKYGKLSGKYVSPEVWNSIRNYGRASFAPGPVGNIYRGLLNRWKLYKTVYNPVTHFNNTWSNVEMLHMAGYHMSDLAGGLRHMAKGEDSGLWREARDNGLFGTDWSASLLKSSEGGGNRGLEELAERLRTQPKIPDAELVTSVMMDVKKWWIDSAHAVANAPTRLKSGAALAKAMAAPVVKGLRIVKKPVDAAAKSAQRLYQFEDEVFKMAVFSAAKRQGKSSAEAVSEAQAFFFDYNDLPEAVKIVRDFPIGSPFISYIYLAIPAIARNIAQNPEKVLALVAGYEAWNYAVLTADGVEPGEYWATVAAEDTVSPPWERGRALWGALNTVHLPFPEAYRLAVGRAHAVGNPFMSEAGGREKLPTVPYLANFWGSSMFGSNPLHAILDTLVNEDWKGKEIYKPGAPTESKAKAIASYLYQAWGPSNALTPGSYHQQKILEGLANDEAKAANRGERTVIAPMVEAANGVADALGLEGFTGLDRTGNEILTRDALLSSFGIKLRPIRWAQSREFELRAQEEAIQEREEYLSAEARKKGEKRITEERFKKARKATKQSIKELIEKQREADKAKDRLQEQGRWR